MEDQAPKVFVSYSHDSPEHKRWVAELAAKLMSSGINVVLDQWELRLGDDLPKFMERGVRDSDRVLMICTEPYVHKADDGKGGVGYEAMIVTGELVEDLGTAKFIPLVRQSTSPKSKPVSVSTRLHIEFSDDAEFDAALEQLIRELHSEPTSRKPALGPNPFAVQRTAEKLNAIDELPIGETHTVPNPANELCAEIGLTYGNALQIAQRGDLVQWRKLIQSTRPKVSEALVEWRSKVEPAFPGKWEEFLPMAKDGVQTYAPLIAIALAGIESGQPQFTNQRAILDDILYPRNWARGGLTVIVNFPTTLAFVYQGLHGATCMISAQPNIALNLVTSNIEFPGWHERIPMWSHHGVMGWPEGFKGEATTGWKTLAALAENWEWLQEIFGDSNEYRSALSAYYMMLNLFEYIEALMTLDGATMNGQDIKLEIPLCYEVESDDVKRRAYSILLSDPNALRAIWRDRSVSDDQVKSSWDSWLRACERFISRVYPYSFGCSITHKGLISELI